MLRDEQDWRRAVEQSWVARFPKQQLATFGTTNLAYYVVTEPIYRELDPIKKEEGVVRTGRVMAERPAIITPTYALNLQGFSSEAYSYLRQLAQLAGPHSPGILYQYSNQPEKVEIVGGSAGEIAQRISDDLEERKENLSVVIVGVDEFWDVSLLKFVYEYITFSARTNYQELDASGLLDPQAAFGGAPRAAIHHIERLFWEAERGGSRDALKAELDRWGLFEFYQDRFLNLFRRKG